MSSFPISIIDQLRRNGILPPEDPQQFMSDANGITGQPIWDPQNDTSGLAVDQSQIQRPMSQARPVSMPLPSTPPPSNLPPQVDLGQMEGSGAGMPPEQPQIQPTPPPQPSLPPTPALQAQSQAPQGPPAPVNLPAPSNGPSIPGQVTPETLISGAYSRMNAPAPQPPSIMRQIAGGLINAAPLGGLGLGPRVEYGKQGLADRQEYARQQAQIPQITSLANTSVALERERQAAKDREETEANRLDKNKQDIQTKQLTEQDTFVKRDEGEFAPAGSAVPPGFVQVRSAPYDPPGMMRIAPTAEQRQKTKLQGEVKTMTITPELANTLGQETGIKAGQIVARETYDKMLEMAKAKVKDPNLHFVVGDNKVTGDQTITAIDPVKGVVVGTTVIKGAVQDRTPAEPGSLSIQEDADGKPVMFNNKTGVVTPVGGVQKAGTKAKADAATEKIEGPARDAMAYADLYAKSNQPTGPGDEALMEKYFELAKPSTGFRMSQSQQDMLKNSRGVWDAIKAKGKHLANGEWFDDKQRQQIIGAMRDLANAKLSSKKNGAATNTDPLGIR